ncbi:MAG: NTP transferase domain-containing protein, partial [Clostridia bacterium]|nr:NTP transferase domain-containing protein [Clostridia bacterium]
MENSAVILAAGDGKRMKSQKSKMLHEVLFKPMIDWVLDAASGAGIGELCVVTGSRHEQLEQHLGGRYETALQHQRLGTAHAVLMAADFIGRHRGGDVAVLYGDVPFIGSDVLAGALELHRAEGNDVTVVSARVEQPYGYGRIRRDASGRVSGVVEEKDAS